MIVGKHFWFVTIFYLMGGPMGLHLLGLPASLGDDKLANAITAWQGEWQTNWGPMVLQFKTDGRFEGNYGKSNHLLRGKLDEKDPHILHGSWKHAGSNSVGLIQFKLNRELTEFRGVYTSGETDPTGKTINWTGKRLAEPFKKPRKWRDGEKPQWAGTWKTTYGDLFLKSVGDGRFAGSYGSLEHSVKGQVHEDGRTLIGTWKHTNSDWTGRFLFQLDSPDHFRGHWTSGDTKPATTVVNWQGTRKSTPPVAKKKKDAIE